MIGIIDYKAGNAPSVGAALDFLGIEYMMVKNDFELINVSHIILPGVGAAKATMDSLKELDLIDALREKVVVNKTPFLGICIGLQVLFDKSDESDTDCLGWIKGHVSKFNKEQVRVPHMGWNTVKYKFEHPLLKNIKDMEYFYFVNSYYVVVDNMNCVLGETKYETVFPAIIVQDNIIATQFHTEKSGSCGLQLLSNFYKECK